MARSSPPLFFACANVPAALFKAMGGFATNGVNMTKLESYQTGGKFFATQFYADIEGHPNDANVKLALEELEFFSAELKILGVYPAHDYRRKIAEPPGKPGASSKSRNLMRVSLDWFLNPTQKIRTGSNASKE